MKRPDLRPPKRLLAALLLAAILLAAVPGGARADGPSPSDLAFLKQVMPGADSFSAKGGQPPVFRAYRTDPSGAQELLGYAFLTSDVPPEVPGYVGPINVMVGLALNGTLTGVRVVDYHESMQRICACDFLRFPGVQEQFSGKSISDAFRIGVDVDAVARASISSDAMARGIRDAARAVAAAYLQPAGGGGLTPEGLANLSWPEMVSRGAVTKLSVTKGGQVGLDIYFADLGNGTLGKLLLGPSTYGSALAQANVRPGGPRPMLLGLDGSFLNLFAPEQLALQQGNRTYPVSRGDFTLMGQPTEGRIAGQVLYDGVLQVSPSVDMARPLTLLYDLRPSLGLYSANYTPVGDLLSPARSSLSPWFSPSANASLSAVPISSAGGGSGFSSQFIGASPTRVAALLGVLALATLAFFRKSPRLRWAALGVTLLYLGVVDGGFLSVSHITSGLAVGPSVYFEDLPLLLLIVFTVATTLLWGRVFCGFLCPFGALQDFLERVVPSRFRRKLPQKAHDRAIYVKYGIFGFIVVMALVRSDVGVYQYFEPFGTVFFVSRSALLWLIALGILVASAVVPRFYCRYLCPLGASLGIASLPSLFRIRRVEQCRFCKVCEHACPTGAIRGPAIDFKECVRCNVCEIKLITRAGTCRHPLREVRARLRRRRAAAP